jgi:hypothetical protein
MSEVLEPRAYLEELRGLQAAVTDAASRAQALDEELKPLAVAGDLDLTGVVFNLERAEERTLQAVRACEILLATEGLPLE